MVTKSLSGLVIATFSPWNFGINLESMSLNSYLKSSSGIMSGRYGKLAKIKSSTYSLFAASVSSVGDGTVT